MEELALADSLTPLNQLYFKQSTLDLSTLTLSDKWFLIINSLLFLITSIMIFTLGWKAKKSEEKNDATSLYYVYMRERSP